MKNRGITFCWIILLINAGCVSLVEKAGEILDGSAFAENKISVYRTGGRGTAEKEIREMQNRDGERSVIIALGQFPSMRIRGTVPNPQGEFNLTSLYYLGGSAHGWNEFRMDIFGSGIMTLGETVASLSIPETIEPVEISFARIKRYDTRITGNEALTALRNRRERILALTEWMNSREDTPVFTDQKEFERYWKPLLFPETVRRGNRPVNWQREGDLTVTAESIRWNTGYTERVFPEILRSIRNSGTMLRDWEEALNWIYIEYEWERIARTLSQETILFWARS